MTVYLVEPTGEFENDPNVTDKRYPGNPTRSYRSTKPLRILGEVHDRTRQTHGEITSTDHRLQGLTFAADTGDSSAMTGS